MSRPVGSSTYHYSAKSHSPVKIFQWIATEYILLNTLYTEKEPEFCVQLLFCIELWPFSQFLQKCHNSRPQWYKVCITSEIVIRDDIIFGLKITHKTALPKLMFKSFTSLFQLHNKPRQKHRKSNFLWSNFCPKWPKIYYSLPWQPLYFEGEISLIFLEYPKKHIIYKNLGEIAEMPCPTLFGGYVERLLKNSQNSCPNNTLQINEH